MGEQLPDYYRLLGVKYGASKEEIEDAYHELARQLHPDVTGNDPTLTARYMAINEAYQVLSKPDERADYDRSIGLEEQAPDEAGDKSGKEGPGPEPKPDFSKKEQTPLGDMRILDARLRKAIKESRKLCKKGNYWEATRLLEKFLKTHPEDAGLRKALATAAMGRKRYHEAVNHMKLACRVEYHNPDNFVQLAAIYVEAGQLMLAEKALREAFGWNAEHDAAKRLQKRIEELKIEGKPPVQRFLSKISKVLKH